MTRPAHNGGSGRVLVVEDDEGIREMLKYNLSTAGFSVQEASAGASGLRTARTARPDLILLDMTVGIVADAKSGVSGAGKAATAKTHYMYAADNLSAYSVFTHRHTGELRVLFLDVRHRLVDGTANVAAFGKSQQMVESRVGR